MQKGKFVGLVGTGYWGKNILRNFSELGVLHTACDSDLAAIAEHKKKYTDVNFETNFENLIGNPEITAVALATPASTHYELVKKALLAGKDVFVEKPLALTVKQGEEIVALAQRERRVLMVGHILQYHPALLKLKDLVSSGELGKIQYIYSNRLNIGKLRVEENILWSFAPHDISVILMLLDEEPVKVSAFQGDYINKNISDTTLTTLEFKNGVKGHIFVSWLHPFKEQKLVVVGTKAMAVFDDQSEEKLFLYPHTISWKDGKIPIAQKADFQVVPFAKGEPLKEELKHFIECVKERKTPKTDGAEGLRVLKVLQASSGLEYAAQEEKKTYFVHESAYVDEGATLGAGSKVWHFSHILKGSRIGKNCVIGQNVITGPDVTIGDGCKIQNNVSVYKGVTLEEGVFCGPSCVFTNVYNPRAFVERKAEFLPTLVKKGATIGANATIVCGNTIGRYALIGAGAVVKADVPDYAIMAGVPARQKGWACKCGVPLKFSSGKAVCGHCSSQYGLENNKFMIINEEI